LLVAALAALVLANSGAGDAFRALLETPVGVSAGTAAFVLPVQGWVNDALMAVFFLLIGLEIRHELAEGQLASLPRAAAPAIGRRCVAGRSRSRPTSPSRWRRCGCSASACRPAWRCF